MGVDIGIKKQTPELKEAYEFNYKAFGSRSNYMSKDNPIYGEYAKKFLNIVEKHPFIENDENLPINGHRWYNLSVQTPNYIPYAENQNILDFSIKQQVLFTEEIKKIVTQFDKVYLILYPEDKYIKDFSKQLHYMVDNNLMLIPC